MQPVGLHALEHGGRTMTESLHCSCAVFALPYRVVHKGVTSLDIAQCSCGGEPALEQAVLRTLSMCLSRCVAQHFRRCASVGAHSFLTPAGCT